MHLPPVEASPCRFENVSAHIWRASRRGACPKSRVRRAFAMNAVTFPWISLFLTTRSGLQRWTSVCGPPAVLLGTFETYSESGFKPTLSVY